MTVVENPGRLEIVFSLPGDKTRRESIMNIRPTATDQDLYDIGVAGTGEGADSAIVMMASRFEDAVGIDPAKRLKIEEILAMPKKTTWVGYG